MRWKGRRESSNIEDRRGAGASAGGISIVGLIVAFVAWKFFGVDPQLAYNATTQVTQRPAAQASAAENADDAEMRRFVATVLGDTEDTWSQIFQAAGSRYTPPTLVLFRGAVQSACGRASAAVGPFYCPADQKVYLDTDFFREMRSQLGISGERNRSELSRSDQAGDFAMAYVIAHEVGHHVQNLTGISAQVRNAQEADPRAANRLSVRLELQADCFAGVWANKNQARTQFLDADDIAEALDAAEKIGDDYLQRRAGGEVVPDSFTHGTSAQRQKWFARGWQSGDIRQCDTFDATPP